jgi:hypothetical protein
LRYRNSGTNGSRTVASVTEARRGHPMIWRSGNAEASEDFTSRIRTATCWRSSHPSRTQTNNVGRSLSWGHQTICSKLHVKPVRRQSRRHPALDRVGERRQRDWSGTTRRDAFQHPVPQSFDRAVVHPVERRAQHACFGASAPEVLGAAEIAPHVDDAGLDPFQSGVSPEPA